MEQTDTAGRAWWAGGRRSRAVTLVIMGVTAIVILGTVYVVNRPTAGSKGFAEVILAGRASGDPPLVGKPAPPISARTVDGRRVTLDGFRGRPVWLTFGASWCQPCRAENPDIESVYEKHRSPNGPVVLAIFISEGAAAVRDYAKRVGLEYEKVADPDTRVASRYRILGIPSHFFIDRRGVLRKSVVGSLNPPAMEAALAQIAR